MLIFKSKRGSSFVDVLVLLFLLGTAGIVFSASFPAAFSESGQAQSYKVATAIAQSKMEQLRTMNYESLTQPLLLSNRVIDASPASSPYNFTSIDNVDGQLKVGTGTLAVDPTDSDDVKKVTVTVSWQGASGQPRRSIQLSTLFADRRTRRAN